jgi:hypothetical protein
LANSSAAGDSRPVPRLIVSGGQTGVDRAALDVAIELGIEHGGWCPAGRLAEDGVIPAQYRLQESHSSDYSVRTEQNVIDSDATLLLFRTSIRGGTGLTARLAIRHARPSLAVDLNAVEWDAEVQRAQLWLADLRPERLNVAGPRESSAPGIHEQSRTFLHRLLTGSD